VTLILPRVANDVVGRAEIQHTLAAALDGAVDGRAATLVVEGEAGSGKTLLMQWLMEHAAERGVLTVAARPVEGEAQLPLAVMTDVLRPLRGWAPRLLPEQRDVLEAAAGGVGEASTDRLLLAAATLALLAAVAEDTPVLLVVDDAHWADPTSGRALSFALRRLLADRVLAVLTRRPTEELRIAGPWEPLELRGLTEPDIAALIEVRTGVTPPPGVVERIRDETLGNPLAVSHLAERLPVDALAGASPLPITLPLQEVARRTFAGLVRALPAGTRSALTVVAAAGSAAARIAPSALRVCGLDVDDLGPAEEAGLITGGSGSVEFGHPLYRATALEVAGAAAVRRAHAALAEAARGRDPQRHAWHLGLSVLGTDEAAAAVVEAAAAAAERRVGAAATVGMRALAVTLSPPGPGCDRRELDSVRALVAAGHHAEARDRLQQLLDADGIADDVRADAFHQLARLLLWDTPLDSQPVAAHIPDDLPPRQMSATLAVAALRARNMAELRRFGDLARAAHAAIHPLADGASRTDPETALPVAVPAPRAPAANAAGAPTAGAPAAPIPAAPRAAFAATAAAAAGARAVAAAAEAAAEAAAAGVVDDAGVAADVAETLVLLPTLSPVAESELVVGEHRGAAVDDAVARVSRLLAAARGAEPGGHPARRTRRLAPRRGGPRPCARGGRVSRRRAAQRLGRRRVGPDADRGGPRPARRRVGAAPSPQACRVAGHAEARDGDVRAGRRARLAGRRGERAHRAARAGRPRPHRRPHRAGDAGGAGDRGGRDQPAGGVHALLQPQDDRVPPHAGVRQARRALPRRAGGPDGDPGAARGRVTST